MVLFFTSYYKNAPIYLVGENFGFDPKFQISQKIADFDPIFESNSCEFLGRKTFSTTPFNFTNAKERYIPFWLPSCLSFVYHLLF